MTVPYPVLHCDVVWMESGCLLGLSSGAWHVDIFLMCLWGQGSLMSSYFTVLIPPLIQDYHVVEDKTRLKQSNRLYMSHNNSRGKA